ncbi:hypothetical protein LCGC14_1122120 [marine sediment metagenome]|uniref:Uncharacterized protein n=1 Tax=marine sediment metagenome TaxID=412755 RepID=A0A0F9MRH0_9ZZZZ
MGDKAWKALERRVAESLGGVRNRMSGAVDQLTAGDVVHDTLFVEIKHRSTLAAITWMKQALPLAAKEGKTALLVMHLKGDKSVYYMFRDKDAEFVCIQLLQQLGWEFET